MPYVEPYGPIGYGIPPGLVRFKDHMLARFPAARFGGMYNPASQTSSGSPSRHQVTQAVDLMCDAATGASIMRYVVAIADSINLQQCISHHEIITVSRWSEGVRRYGPDDHAGGNGHAHIEMGWQAALNWQSPGGSTAPIPGGPELTPDEMNAIFKHIDTVVVQQVDRAVGTLQTNLRDAVKAISETVGKIQPGTGSGASAAQVADEFGKRLGRA